MIHQRKNKPRLGMKGVLQSNGPYLQRCFNNTINLLLRQQVPENTSQSIIPSINTPINSIQAQEKSSAIGSPILSMTPITSIPREQGSEVAYVDDLTPIEPEEMPPANFFFSKKRKAIVQGKIQKKDGSMEMRQRIIYDGQGKNNQEFAKNMEETLGDFATTNQWSVNVLNTDLDQRDYQISQLQEILKKKDADIEKQVSSRVTQVQQQCQQQMKELEEKLKTLY
jgi:hypothetical protein